MTACAAKFSSSAICLSENAPYLLTVNPEDANYNAIFEKWNCKRGTRATEIDESAVSCGTAQVRSYQPSYPRHEEVVLFRGVARLGLRPARLGFSL